MCYYNACVWLPGIGRIKATTKEKLQTIIECVKMSCWLKGLVAIRFYLDCVDMEEQDDYLATILVIGGKWFGTHNIYLKTQSQEFIAIQKLLFHSHVKYFF